LSGSSEAGKTAGKQWIFSAISGLALLLCSFLVLYTINIDLISLANPELIQINAPEPPGQTTINLGNKTGILPDKVTFSNPKYPNMEQRFNDRAPNNLREVVNGLPFPVTITCYDEGQHVTNSDHYQGKAIDIWMENLTDEQIKALMNYLNNDPNVSKTINARFPGMNTLFGRPHAYSHTTLYGNGSPGSYGHTRHIHVSVY
jgi:hypothetical protein